MLLDERRWWMLREVVEPLDVHLQRQRLELGGDLLQAESLAQAHVDIPVRGWDFEEGDELLRRHVPPQDVVSGVELRADSAPDGDEQERPRGGPGGLVL